MIWEAWGPVLDTVLKAGANRFQGLSFGVNDPSAVADRIRGERGRWATPPAPTPHSPPPTSSRARRSRTSACTRVRWRPAAASPVDGQDQRQTHGLGHVPGAARGSHGGLADLRRSRSTISASSRPISAAASATRSASIPAISAHRRLDRHGVPVKWVEDRIENLSTTAFARDYHMTGEHRRHQGRQDHRPVCHVLADHGAFDACADPTKVPRRLLQHLHRVLRHPGRLCRRRRRLHQQGAGRRRLSLFVPGDRSVLLHRAHDRRARPQAGHGPGRTAP